MNFPISLFYYEQMIVNLVPLDLIVLVRQFDHRHQIIWDLSDNETSEIYLVAWRWDSKFWYLYDASSIPVKEYIDMLGFWGVSCACYHTHNWGLIIALIERLRPEIFTFHFTSGEATIPLQDVALLWGLPIDGDG